MARYIRRRRYRETLGKYSRNLLMGLVTMGLAATIMALGGATASALKGYMAYNMSIGGSSITLDLGFIPGLALSFGGLFLFLKGLRKVGVSL